MPTEHDKHIFVNNFTCDLIEDLSRISSITMSIPKVAATTGADVTYTAHRPGRPTFGNITFEGPVHDQSIKKIREWVKTGYDGGDARKDITIEIKNQKGDTVRTFNLMTTLPVAFSSIDCTSQGGGGTLHWILEVRVERIEMK